MNRQLPRTAADQARSAVVAAYEMTPARYAQIYATARDWAEEVACELGGGTLPVWTPSFSEARERVGGMRQDAELCANLAADAWRRMREFWE